MSKSSGKGKGTLRSTKQVNDPILKEYEKLSVEELKNELQKLERERDEKKLIFEKLKKSHSLRDVIDKENINDSMTTSQNELQEDMVQEMLQDNKEHEYEEILNAYRLTGKTIFPVKEKYTGLRFETFYKAKYLEPYYIILDQNQENEQLSVFRHTMPHFIPLSELEATYLNKDMDKFVNAVDDYLQAFVTRREEVNALSERGATEIKSNNACSSIEFVIRLAEDADRVEVSLTYNDLKSSIPTNAMIYRFKEEQRQRLRKREQVFLKQSLMNAFDDTFGNFRN